MTTPLGEIHKPEAERFKSGRKVYLVPLFVAPPNAPAELQQKMERYWTGAKEHVARLEAGLGPVNRIYHEMVFLPGDEGARLVEQMNPQGYSMVNARRQAGAELEVVEDRALVEESGDWQMCLSLGLVSQKASSTVFQAYMDATAQRYQHIASRIDETLKEDESAILIIGDNHRVQFPGDMQVFYVAPPALDELRRWINDRQSGVAGRGEGAVPPDEEQPEEGSKSEEEHINE